MPYHWHLLPCSYPVKVSTLLEFMIAADYILYSKWHCKALFYTYFLSTYSFLYPLPHFPLTLRENMLNVFFRAKHSPTTYSQHLVQWWGFFVQKKASVIKTGSTIYLLPQAEASRNQFDAGNSAKPRCSVLTNACDLPWCELLNRFAILEMDFLLWREPQNMSQ